MLNYFSTRDASNILGIKTGRLRYWKRIGLVTPSNLRKGRRCYGFQDLICLKTAQGLVTQGLQATQMRNGVESLKRKFPGFDNYLANKRVYVFGSHAIIRHKDGFIEPQSGQLLFEFDLDDFAEEVEHRIKPFESKKTAEGWFQEGLRYDSSKETYPFALEAYQKAVELDPNFGDAYLNLGNIYYRQELFVDAERCYRLAITCDPDHAKAYYNLGNTLDELHCTQEAGDCFQKSLEKDPNFSDAQYNLAATCEKLTLWDAACTHWKSYLNLDPVGKHADFARKRIKLLQSNLEPRSQK
ncbi:MAG: tetratricopeptide repeat protein [Acidobacteria bacterium]|nr:MAG: tetratricopeptide repeat protein [Acidobacteriota bacterium]TDI15864.1 MAG: tetratricopeptide repeat protein [Acidobacteriota bacterium]